MYDRISILLQLWKEKFPERKLGGDTLEEGKANLKPYTNASDDVEANEQAHRISIGVRMRLEKPAKSHLNRYIHAIFSDKDLGGANSELLRPLNLKMELEKKRPPGRPPNPTPETTPPAEEQPPAQEETPPEAAA